jgi:hypothetical protein
MRSKLLVYINRPPGLSTPLVARGVVVPETGPIIGEGWAAAGTADLCTAQHGAVAIGAGLPCILGILSIFCIMIYASCARLAC